VGNATQNEAALPPGTGVEPADPGPAPPPPPPVSVTVTSAPGGGTAYATEDTRAVSTAGERRYGIDSRQGQGGRKEAQQV
jgi:hypothetical protein